MRINSIIVLIALCVFTFAVAPSVAAEFYVVKSRSGILMIRDHKPQGRATIVKGPFKTMQEAENALQQVESGGSNRKPVPK